MESNRGETSLGVSNWKKQADAALLTWAAPSDTISSNRTRYQVNPCIGSKHLTGQIAILGLHTLFSCSS